MSGRRESARGTNDYPGWAWMLFGLAIGLSVALAIFVNGRETALEPEPVAQQPASLSAPVQDEEVAAGEQAVVAGGETATARATTAGNETAAGEAAAAELPAQRFDFYDMLPNFEVIIPEEEKEVSTDTAERAVVTPGVYVLQVGSFTEYADADRRRAQLALQGIESAIQRVRIEDKTYHRVRVGPIEDLETLNLLRSRLREADMDVLRIRLSD